MVWVVLYVISVTPNIEDGPLLVVNVIPSRKLTYPPKIFEDDFPFSQGGDMLIPWRVAPIIGPVNGLYKWVIGDISSISGSYIPTYQLVRGGPTLLVKWSNLTMRLRIGTVPRSVRGAKFMSAPLTLWSFGVAHATTSCPWDFFLGH